MLELVLDQTHEKSSAFAVFPLKDNIISSLKTTIPGFAAASYTRSVPNIIAFVNVSSSRISGF